MAKISHNILANLVGRAWTMLMGIAFVPIYLKYLGIEAYGLIGFFATLQGILGILDLGMGMTLNREFARNSVRPDERSQMANLLRTLEIIYWTLAILAGALVFFMAPWIAANWVNAVHIPVKSVESAIKMMGIIFALQAPFAFYQGGLMGLQHQVANNFILAVVATLKGLGAVFVIWIISPTIQAFFAWQVIVSGGATAIIGIYLWRCVPHSLFRPRFDFMALKNVWHFGLTVSANAIVGISLTQLDKIILLKLLPLEQFGYYALAGVVASVLWAIIIPINSALFPRFAQLHDQKDEIGLAALYHKACQLMAAVLLPIAILLMLFSREILFMWTGNQATADNTYMLVSLLVLGTTLNGLTSVPGYLQGAAGWPGLILRTNFTLALFLVPLMLIFVPKYGAVGAATVWAMINTSYLLVTVPIMHTRILKGELNVWYMRDIILPTFATLAILMPAKLIMPIGMNIVVQITYLICCWCLAVVAVISVTPRVRTELLSRYKELFGRKISIVH